MQTVCCRTDNNNNTLVRSFMNTFISHEHAQTNRVCCFQTFMFGCCIAKGSVFRLSMCLIAL